MVPESAAGRLPDPGASRAPAFVAVAVVAAAAVAAIILAPSSGRADVAVAVAIGLTAAVVLAVRQTTATERLVDQLAEVRAQLAQRSVGLEQLAYDSLPKVVGQLRGGVSIDEAIGSVPALADPAEQRILRSIAEEVGRSERMRAAAMAACANAAGRVQALSTSMLADLRDMEDRYDEDVLGDLLRLDHSTAQAGRLADSIAVLTGARSGRRWTKPIVMESILRGALGRISAYQRVRLHSMSRVAVAGYAAEGVMHALAELMDNATSFSPPSEEVHVYVEEVQAGIVVTIEDGGLVMGPAALRRAERAVSAEQLDLTTLSGTRLGLAVVGVLARKHGLTVSFRPSSRGGTGVVVIIPRQLITQPRPEDAPSSRGPATTSRLAMAQASRPGVEQGAQPAVREDDALPSRGGSDADGPATGALPKRDPGHTLAVSSRPTAQAEAREPRPPSVSASSRFGAFQQASRARSTNTGPRPVAGDPPAGNEEGQ
jgi:signal transduction histidine kinase